MTGLTQRPLTGVLGPMKRAFLLSLGILSCSVTPACAAGDVDLLSFDPVPQKKISDAPPVEVTPPQSKPAPQPPPAAIKFMPVPEPDVTKEAPVTQVKPAQAQPPVEVKKPVRPVAPKPVAKPESPKVVQKVEPPKEPVKAVIKEVAPAEAVKPPSMEALDPAIKPLPPEALHDKAPAKNIVLPKNKVKEEVPPAAPESFMKLKDAVIQIGDPLRIEVAGEGDLSGWYKVQPDGSISLPMIGKVRAQGFTIGKLAEILTATLKDGYLVNPEVSVTGKAVP